MKKFPSALRREKAAGTGAWPGRKLKGTRFSRKAEIKIVADENRSNIFSATGRRAIFRLLLQE
jgi:hypothetical protein